MLRPECSSDAQPQGSITSLATVADEDAQRMSQSGAQVAAELTLESECMQTERRLKIGYQWSRAPDLAGTGQDTA